MRNNKKRLILPTAALMLSSVLLSCKTSRNEAVEKVLDNDCKEKMDSFKPTHPPVVVPHSWRESKESKVH